ncbi:HAD family phosphatase [Aurantimonas sp. VKM B-3413]|uniref:HAD family hydrolase n=1 Tax=Aurantimonas sp. VKM B-3413 TaxID=2779401 RepID=UPI001E33E009|nr:HAD family phosphatase [Aurantimonas sp. VKM B-3413]MCB8837421.1 HAD family phosphatase [Aurantimonas sp. VKM B-3413]
MPVAHIVFDIGKVLIHYDPHLAFHDIIPDPDERTFFLAEVCSHAWNLEQDRGRDWQEAEAEAISRHPDRADQIRAFRANWAKMVPHAYDGSVEILRELIGAGVDVTMLTNFAADTFREAQVKFPFLTESRGVTVSGEIALIKPDRAIFDHHARAFGLRPAETVFIDDSLPNVEGARTAGWQAVHFTSPETLRADLRSLGVPLEDGAMERA